MRGSSGGSLWWDSTEFLCVSVTDTGIGVTDDKKGLLFKAFSQVQAIQSNGERDREIERDGKERAFQAA